MGSALDTASVYRDADRLLREFETAVVPGRFFDAPAHFRLGFGCETPVLREGLERLGRALRAGA